MAPARGSSLAKWHKQAANMDSNSAAFHLFIIIFLQPSTNFICLTFRFTAPFLNSFLPSADEETTAPSFAVKHA